MGSAFPPASSHDGTKARRRVLLANPRGFCAGVRRAIDAVEQALAVHGPPVYVRRAIVHNAEVVDRLTAKGAVFVQEVDEVPEGSATILSAHGSARSVRVAAEGRRLRVVDAVCPLVSKVHAEVDAWHRAGRHVLLIGHVGHPEVIGTLGQLPVGAISVVGGPEDLDVLDLAPGSAVAYAVQTTFSVREAAQVIAAITARFPDVAGPRASDICYATTNRQEAIEALAEACDLVLVVGDTMSSNARRLVEVALAAGAADARLAAGVADLPRELVTTARTIGLTAAASTPESAITAVCSALSDEGFELVEAPGEAERVRFRPVPLEPLGGDAISVGR